MEVGAGKRVGEWSCPRANHGHPPRAIFSAAVGALARHGSEVSSHCRGQPEGGLFVLHNTE